MFYCHESIFLHPPQRPAISDVAGIKATDTTSGIIAIRDRLLTAAEIAQLGMFSVFYIVMKDSGICELRLCSGVLYFINCFQRPLKK